MKCEICGKAPDLILLLPLHQPDGKLCTFACEDCAKQSSAFCLAHNEIHQGFTDGSTACLRCIEEVVQARESDALNIWESISKNLSPVEVGWLRCAYEISFLITGDEEEISILRFLASKAFRTHTTLDDVIQEVKTRRSVEYILFS